MFRDWDIAELIEVLPTCTKSWVLFPGVYKTVVVHTHNPTILKVKAGGPGAQCHPWLQGELGASLRYVLKVKEEEKEKKK